MILCHPGPVYRGVDLLPEGLSTEPNGEPAAEANADPLVEVIAQVTPAGLEPKEIPWAPERAYRATLPAKLPGRKSPTSLNQPTAGPKNLPTARADEKASRKRKRISSTDPLIYSPRPSKRNNTSKITKRFCWELDHGVSGFVSNVKGSIACEKDIEFALDFIGNAAYSVSGQDPAPSTFFPPGSTRTISHTHDMKRKVIMFTDDICVVELYAIACAMKFALDHIGNTACAVSSEDSAQSGLFPPGSARTMLHTHDMEREVIVFTDDWFALQRLTGTLANTVGGDPIPTS
ncbi:hypothetical protein N7530_007271 [Penicillium desertorum]|uniref:Uncharacterized protein n=1 Tax=Penicillium desertorum TaxID=1303715 RepID=A0A9X0BJW6_9EURO|nr:hypothetical protein N7530_007271 [Penicillium desertorum]